MATQLRTEQTHVLAQDLRKLSGHRVHAKPLFHPLLRPAQVTGEDNLSTLVHQELDSRARRGQSGGVGNNRRGVLGKRRIEVHLLCFMFSARKMK